MLFKTVADPKTDRSIPDIKGYVKDYRQLLYC